MPDLMEALQSSSNQPIPGGLQEFLTHIGQLKDPEHKTCREIIRNNKHFLVERIENAISTE